MPDPPDPPAPTNAPPDGAAQSRTALRAFVALHDIACPTCGFNLRGCAEERCPECGETYGAYLALGPPTAVFRDRASVLRTVGATLLAVVAVAHLSVGAVGLIAAFASAFSFGVYGGWTEVIGHLVAGAAAAGLLAADRIVGAAAPRARELVRILAIVAIALLGAFSLAPALLSAVLMLLTTIGGAL
ncbi:MAG: hypothetical protein ACF8QF_13010 [Phycisphaerales bacterium]